MDIHFKHWLENEAKDFDFYHNLIVNYLGLDNDKGLSQNLDTFNQENLKQKLQALGEFSALPDDVKMEILARIDSGQGTVGDLIKIMAYKRD